MNKITLGTMQFFWTADSRNAFEIFDAFAANGGKAIDTANMYPQWVPGYQGGETEELVGLWMKKSKKRNKIILSSKVRSRMWKGAWGEGLGKRHILKACDDSLKRLQTDFIDIYYAHWPDPTTPLEETIEAFVLLKKQGKIRAVGCSNYSPADLKTFLKLAKQYQLGTTAVQAEYNLITRKLVENDLLQTLKHFDNQLLAYSPLAGGFLTGDYGKDKPTPFHDRAKFIKEKLTPKNLGVLDCLRQLAKKYHATCSQVALSWLLTRQGLQGIILGADTVLQLEENLKSRFLLLSSSDRKALESYTKP